MLADKYEFVAGDWSGHYLHCHSYPVPNVKLILNVHLNPSFQKLHM